MTTTNLREMSNEELVTNLTRACRYAGVIQDGENSERANDMAVELEAELRRRLED